MNNAFIATLHYVLWGAAEGRSPSAWFDGDSYLRRHPWVASADLNPLWHYVTQGRQAGLQIQRPPALDMPRLAISDANYQVWLAAMAASSAQTQDRPAPRDQALPEVAVCARTPQPHYGQTGLDVAGDAQAVLLVPDNVIVPPAALLEFRRALAQTPDADMIYADEDRIDGSGARTAPWFKPGWDPDLMLSADLSGPATLFRRAFLEQLGWDGRSVDQLGLRALALQAAGLPCRVVHIAKVLAHRTDAMTVPDTLLVQAHLTRRGINARVEAAECGRMVNRITFAVPHPAPLVSVIIPTRDRAALLALACRGVLAQTDYSNLELIIVDNDSAEPATHQLLSDLAQDSRVRVIGFAGPFNWSALNNHAARAARGDILVLLNNDIEVISADWLNILVAHAVQPDIGAAGAKLLYPDRTIQHAGMTIGSTGISTHLLRRAERDSPGQAGEACVTHTVAAVTGACLAVRRAVFEAVGGLETAHLGITSGDVDFCLRLRATGYRVVYTPQAELIHHEAATRGLDLAPAQKRRVQAEHAYLRAAWGERMLWDPYLNPNLCVMRNQLALQPPARVAELPRYAAVTHHADAAGKPPSPRAPERAVPREANVALAPVAGLSHFA